jgi:hypothetical protein
MLRSLTVVLTLTGRPSEALYRAGRWSMGCCTYSDV